MKFFIGYDKSGLSIEGSAVYSKDEFKENIEYREFDTNKKYAMKDKDPEIVCGFEIYRVQIIIEFVLDGKIG